MEWLVSLVIISSIALSKCEISATESIMESITELTNDNTTESIMESITELTTGNTTESIMESITELTTGNTTESIMESITELTTGTTTKSIMESIAELTTGLTTESATESTTLSTASTKFRRRTFPKEFMFGAATSAYQVEGAWNEDGKTPNVWDLICHKEYSKTPAVIDLSNGDIAADTYHYYKRDVQMMRELGLAAYGMSLSWSRILPTCQMDNVNHHAIDFYNAYINEMLKFNITPIVTLFHMDLPQCIMRKGGFLKHTIVELFEQYARTAFMLFGDRVKHWITFGEPKQFCQENYGWKPYPVYFPRMSYVNNEYQCARYLLLAHATAYRAYDRDFKLAQNGVCGISIVVNWFHIYNTEEQEAAELFKQMQWKLYTEPIFSACGGFPNQLVRNLNCHQYPSVIRQFTEKEKLFIKGTYDFFGLGHYGGYSLNGSSFEKWNVTSMYDNLAEKAQEHGGNPICNPLDDVGIPNALYRTLTDLSIRYRGPEFLITRVGWHSQETDLNGGMEDDERILFLRSMLDDCYNALLAGIRITGFLYWSLMDTFEWQEGYSIRSGLYSVNLTDPMRERTARKSALVYKHAIKTRSVDYGYDPPYGDMDDLMKL